MNNIKTPYEDLLRNVLNHGDRKEDRTGTGTISVFGRQIRYDLAEGFPLITTKKVFTRGVFAELLWFLAGDTNEYTLRDQSVNIWREWSPDGGELGPVYGHQWRHWDSARKPGKHHDQISELITNLSADPFSRRHIISAWNVDDIPLMALAPCHTMFQFNVRPGAKGEPLWLDCQLYQRSADLFLGVPFNIASYAALVHMIAAQVGLQPGHFVHTFGDAHIYINHVEQVVEQLSRDPRPYPTLTVAERPSLFAHKLNDFVLTGYDPHPAIKAPVAV